MVNTNLWHTQGSENLYQWWINSYFAKALNSPVVIVNTDRNDLDNLKTIYY